MSILCCQMQERVSSLAFRDLVDDILVMIHQLGNLLHHLEFTHLSWNQKLLLALIHRHLLHLHFTHGLSVVHKVRLEALNRQVCLLQILETAQVADPLVLVQPLLVCDCLVFWAWHDGASRAHTHNLDPPVLLLFLSLSQLSLGTYDLDVVLRVLLLVLGCDILVRLERGFTLALTLIVLHIQGLLELVEKHCIVWLLPEGEHTVVLLDWRLVGDAWGILGLALAILG